VPVVGVNGIAFRDVGFAAAIVPGGRQRTSTVCGRASPSQFIPKAALHCCLVDVTRGHTASLALSGPSMPLRLIDAPYASLPQ